MLRIICRPSRLTVFSSQLRGPKAAGGKKAAAPGANLEPGILLVRTADTEPELKDMNHYPAWLSKLAMPDMKAPAYMQLVAAQDQDYFTLDYKDLKFLRRKFKKAKDLKKKGLLMFKEKGEESDYELPGENFSRVQWREEVIENEKASKGKKGKKQSDEDDEDEEDDDDEEDIDA